MKVLFVIYLCLFSLMIHSQSRLYHKAKVIFKEFELDSIKYKNDSDGKLYLEFYPDSNVIVHYYLNQDSICTSVLIQSFTQEMTDFLIGNYLQRGYLKIQEGWLISDNDLVVKIKHTINEYGANLFHHEEFYLY
jgi:hypothetical protein